MLRQPPFRDFPPYLKILSLLLVVVSTALLVMAVGLGLAILFFGKDILSEISNPASYSDHVTVIALRYFQIVNQFGVFILPALIFVLLTDNDIPGYLKLRGGWHRMSIVQGIVLLLVSLPVVHWLMEVNNSIHLPEFLTSLEDWLKARERDAELLTDAFLSTESIGGFLFNLLMIAAIAAVGEELIFRGILVRLFHEWTRNIHIAVFLPAIIFSALHLQFYGFLPRMVLGLFLGYLFVWTGSLRIPIIIHFANNAFAVILAFMESRGCLTMDVEQIGSSRNPWIITVSVIMSVVVLVVIYFYERRTLLRAQKKTGD
jgi:membrane protease YdiL (CAAX protease family)